MGSEISTGIRHTLRRRRQLEADIAHVTEEMYRRNVELAETISTLSLLQKINNLFVESTRSVTEFASDVCCVIAEDTYHRYVGVYKVSSIGADVFASSDDKLASAVRQLKLPSDWGGDTKSYTVLDVRYNDITKLYIRRLSTKLPTPLLFVVGYLEDEEVAPKKDQLLFDRLADTVGVVLDAKELAEQNKHVLSQLQRTNAKLKALDEAKDEFISMASHQLRTPLTSIKGYLSMVLEGDVGTISDQQREMLSTSYASAQRMVYLIADLLNVSRLQTGKFVIEKAECYLPDMISEELAQLKEAAAAKKITFSYEKPKDFPRMQLDETKIRQVIMNFADNALYYTPAGGKVKIELKKSAKSIEFTVTDNGIGVPKAEQHKLFGKFFRAGNAQKARPDGTGLGLFMAKKVVVASGGAIIFRSTEGKGSTFGFTFPIN